MSVTITICGNIEHCDSHGLAKQNIEECLCVHDSKPNPTCHYCQGGGKWVETVYPFEMNVANRNFFTLWNALGLTKGVDDYEGSLDGRVVMRAIDSLDLSLVLRSPSASIQPGRPELFDGGISQDQASRYIGMLKAICEEAERRESDVCWG